MDRRKFIRNTSLLSVAAGFSSTGISAVVQKKSGLTVAFLNDIHVKPTEVAESGMRRAFRHANALKQKPDFIINGGDAIMDAMAADKEKTQAQWDIWHKVLREENRLPLYHVIGNHDAWGWQLKDESVKLDPLYDKAWPVREHKMPGRFYAFSKERWKFIVLDSAHENNGGYIARIDEPQMAWLEAELKNTPTNQHICIVSHIPIISFCAALFNDENLPNGDWKVSRALLHTDARKLSQLFSGFSNVKCCLSGHIHLQDVVEYKGVRYYCNGAVSGSWWNGPFKGFQPAYSVFSFDKNGGVERQMVNY